MISKPKITVLMAEYNTDTGYLVEAITSILHQTFKDFEFIIIDDCGKNKLASIASELGDSRIRIIKNAKNMGLVYSLNNGIKHARGKYIVRMDSDDIAMPERIEKLYGYITAHPEYDVVGSRVMEISDNGNVGILGSESEKINKLVMHGDVPIHPSIIVKTDVLRSLGGYENYNRAEDLALWCKMLIAGKRIYVIDSVLLKYRVNKSDYSKRKLANRWGEIKARINFYPQMGASLFDYLYILKNIVSGMMPNFLVIQYRKKFVLQQDYKSGSNTPGDGL